MRTMTPMNLSDFDSGPFRHQLSVRIDASREAVFAELADPARWLTWFPLMHEAAWVTPQVAMVGAEREVALYVFGRFRERMIAWEPNLRFAFTMTASTSPLASQMAEDNRLTSNADGTTQLDYTVAFTPTAIGKLAFPALRLVMTALVLRACRNLERSLFVPAPSA